jgi:hypothetical protein
MKAYCKRGIACYHLLGLLIVTLATTKNVKRSNIMQAGTTFLPQREKYGRGDIDKGPMNGDCALYRKEAFQEVVRREAVRSSRSGRSPLLLLFDVSVCGQTEMIRKITSVLSSSTREIDVKGWYTDGAVMGILFTEFGTMHNAVDAAREAITGRLYGSLAGMLSNEDMLQMKITPCPLSQEAVASNAQRVSGPGGI